ncbi:MAG: ABC transporter substrate-binding protein [Halieaceae bacterium]|jgi:NitT/TauT family transport system substrate-binding protein|nr:ABC transporter substrate-binding protein [Halieaceae bacterium]
MNRLCWIIIFTLLTACSPDVAPPLRLGTNVWIGYEPLYLARHEGFISEDVVQLVEYANSSDVLRGLKTGVLDAGALTLDEAINLQSEVEGDAFVIVHVMDISHGADAIVARPPINAIEDIRGKTVGFEITALGSYFFQRALDFTGLTTDDVVMVNVEIDDQMDAWAQGNIDVVVTFDPIRSQLLAEGANQIFSSRDIPGEIVDLLVVRRSVLQQRADALEHIITGWYEAVALLQRDPQYAYPIMDERLRLGVDGIVAAYSGIRIPTRDESAAMVSGPLPRMIQAADTMQRIMLQSDLLAQPVESSRLFSRHIPGLNN